MAAKVTPRQTLLLWKLIAEGGQFQTEIKPVIAAKDRAAMLRDRLVTLDRRQKGGKGRPLIFLDATDAGWSWAAEHLDAPLPVRSQSAGPILQAWLTKLKAYMDRTGTPLATILSEHQEAGSPTSRIEQIDEQIQSAYLAVTKGRWSARARLSEIRPLLDGVPRKTLDANLREMQRAKRLVLYPLDNPREIQPVDRDAAISIGGEPVHIVIMRQP